MILVSGHSWEVVNRTSFRLLSCSQPPSTTILHLLFCHGSMFRRSPQPLFVVHSRCDEKIEAHNLKLYPYNMAVLYFGRFIFGNQNRICRRAIESIREWYITFARFIRNGQTNYRMRLAANRFHSCLIFALAPLPTRPATAWTPLHRL